MIRLLLIAVAVFVAAGAGALVYAQLSDSQTASGTVNVTTTSDDLYICEPGAAPGPACGPDDSADDETIFETVEDLRPGDTSQWDIRLKNIGPVMWRITGVALSIVETADPGADCPSNALQAARHPTNSEPSPSGVFILGKAGNDLNDNDLSGPGDPIGFLRWFNPGGATRYAQVKVAPGDYEDMRFRLQLLSVPGVENCDGNQWTASWNFTVFE